VCQKVYKRICFISDEQFSIIRQHVLLGNEMSYIPHTRMKMVPGRGSTASTSSLDIPLHTMKQSDIRQYFTKTG
jgi:hypothetical protein